MCVVFKTVQPRHRFRAAIGLFSYSYFPFRRSTLSNSYSHTLFTPLSTLCTAVVLLLQATAGRIRAHRLLLRRSLPLCLHPTLSNSYSHTQYTPLHILLQPFPLSSYSHAVLHSLIPVNTTPAYV